MKARTSRAASREIASDIGERAKQAPRNSRGAAGERYAKNTKRLALLARPYPGLGRDRGVLGGHGMVGRG